jgi:hypothetical protein
MSSSPSPALHIPQSAILQPPTSIIYPLSSVLYHQSSSIAFHISHPFDPKSLIINSTIIIHLIVSFRSQNVFIAMLRMTKAVDSEDSDYAEIDGEFGWCESWSRIRDKV